MRILKPHTGLWSLFLFLTVGILTLVTGSSAVALTNKQLVRLAKLEIYPTQLENYKAALKVGIETPLRVEPGVLTLYAVAEKNDPTHITILEIYASEAAYQAHLKTPYFLAYKTGTAKMVKSLDLVETVPVAPGVKVK
ncbi:antibiotic biosynthesis monooxygenase (plasmid) [Hymenobacter tibetensis]|uniref:Antibiotic biosynthesis monooxygenase n=1 Tax=Hymenobacter tibetensis TaxID=497967 RepID=A0ABY4D5D7_9BACT|nr:antibiotic biosynthesis monooxygenase family protein [Hymenobacter tibetensis]UOG77491.1 antibiotic biosynthesis monooxygenase [Hymenobacter tibetensis]